MADSSSKATLPLILAALNTEQETLRAQGIEPQTLVAIYNDFIQRKPELTDIAEMTTGTLLLAREVHAVRYRVKDPLHLLRKVIRKKSEYPERNIDEHNYLDWINDLVGVRVMHLYKELWRATGQFIQETWKLKRPPIAYVAAGESGPLVQQFIDAGYDIRQHAHGYRAVHFVICTQPNKQRYFVEVQLRTLFEEGWSEIDHAIRYPDHICSAFVRDLLNILNRMTGQADLMAAFIKSILNKAQGQALLTTEEKRQLLAQLEALPVTDVEKQRLHDHLQRMMAGGNTGQV
jgi:ppGpp synthetase/RelA/SpoT-type nucleotidyltranferase